MHHILGQPVALNVIQQALDSGRVHHAWIFYGPPGVGKHTAAVAFAKVLLCPNAQADFSGHVSACGSCESCKMIDDPEAAHSDLHLINKELALYSDSRQVRDSKQITIPLDVLRTRLLEPAGRKAQLNHGKVFIVDEAELLDLNGQNTLLKTLEEPPSGSYLILVTSQDDKLLPTIRSRCQRVSFTLLDDQAVADAAPRFIEQTIAALDEQIAAVQAQSKIGKETKERLAQWQQHHKELTTQKQRVIDAAVSFARGSPGRAQLAIAYRLYTWPKQVGGRLESLSRCENDGLELGGVAAEMCNEFAVRWVEAHTNASKDAANKLAVRLMLGLIADLCRQRLRDLNGDIDASEPWLRGIDLVRGAEEHLAANVQVAWLMENLTVQWSVAMRLEA